MLAAKGRVGLFVGVGAGLLIAGLLIVQAVSINNLLETNTETVVTSSRSTPTSATSSSSPSVVGSVGLHYVTFYDSGPCGANATWGAHLTEWGVQLGNRTRTEPPNIALSEIPEDGYSADSSFNMTRIVFLVPSGVYNFTLYPTAFMRVGSSNGTATGGSTGTTTVTNSDVNVYTGSSAFSVECQQ
jgi:hypothetical protein